MTAFDAAGLAGLVLRCGYRLERLVSPTLRFDVQVAAVVESAERGDWLDVLVAAAKAANPTNRLIAALPDRFYDDSDPFPAPALDFQRTAGNRIVTTKDGMAMVLVSAENTPPFWIDAQPVTNAAYLRFSASDGVRGAARVESLRRLYAGDGLAPVVWCRAWTRCAMRRGREAAADGGGGGCGATGGRWGVGDTP